jgi:hypothetical protein
MAVPYSKECKEVQGAVDSLQHEVALLLCDLWEELLPSFILQIEALQVSQLTLKSGEQSSQRFHPFVQLLMPVPRRLFRLVEPAILRLECVAFLPRVMELLLQDRFLILERLQPRRGALLLGSFEAPIH